MWQHPNSKKWYCIDFAVMRQKDCLNSKSLDARVMRGAVCHTDHQLLVVRVKVTGKGLHRKTSSKIGWFDVSKLKSGEECTSWEMFQEETVSKICAAWPGGGSVDKKWSVIRSALPNAAETALGFGVKQQPDWFSESEATIQPALRHRNELTGSGFVPRKQQTSRDFVVLAEKLAVQS